MVPNKITILSLNYPEKFFFSVKKKITNFFTIVLTNHKTEKKNIQLKFLQKISKRYLFQCLLIFIAPIIMPNVC
jgi:hypothetical protein